MKYLFIFIISMVPIFENKGSILVAAGMRLNWAITLLLTTMGTAIYVPLILKFVDKILYWAQQFKYTKNSLVKVEAFKERRAEFLNRYGPFSILFIVSIPFTGIGIWLGCILATFLGIEYKKSVITLIGAGFISGLITVLSAYGILSLVGFY